MLCFHRSRQTTKNTPSCLCKSGIIPPGKSLCETLAVMWAISHFHTYLYGHDVLVYTHHSAVRAVLQTPSANGKHARWWSKIFGSGLRSIQIKYRPGKDNCNADGLSRCSVSSPPADELISTTQIAVVQSEECTNISELLAVPPLTSSYQDFSVEQAKDPEIQQLLCFIQHGTLTRK